MVISKEAVAELPHDLVHSILDILQDDGETLKSTAQVSKAFYYVSQAHLFRTTVLRTTGQARRILNLLRSSSRLCGLIQSLSVSYECLPGLNIGDDLAEIHPDHDVLASILSLLQGISSITFSREQTRGNARGRDWTDLSPHLQKAVETLFGLETITHLSICEFYNLPRSLFCHFRRHIRLELDVVHIAPEDGEYDETMDVHNLHVEIYFTMAKGERRTQNKALYPYSTLPVMLSGASNTLTSLSIRWLAKGLAHRLFSECNFGYIPNLEMLDLSFLVFDPVSHIEWFHKLIRSLDERCPLTNLTVDFGCINHYGGSLALAINKFSRDANWNLCDAELKKFTNLSRFKAQIKGYLTGREKAHVHSIRKTLELSMSSVFSPPLSMSGSKNLALKCEVEEDVHRVGLYAALCISYCLEHDRQ